MATIDLRDHRGVVARLLARALDRLEQEQPDFAVGCIAIFSNPCEGHVDVCFDSRTLADMDDWERNCADFELDFFDDVPVEAWREAYWCDDPTIEIVNEDGQRVVLNDRANHYFDEPIFRFLEAELARSLPQLVDRDNVVSKGLTLGVQIHDSALVHYWQAGAVETELE